MGFNEQIEPNKERNGYAKKKKSIITLCFVVVCAILLNYVAFIGFNIAGFSYGGMFGETDIKRAST